MERGEVEERHSQGLARRRRFLLDLAYPVPTTYLADQFGLPPSSEDVSAQEIDASLARIQRMIDSDLAMYLMGTAADMSAILSALEVSDPEELRMWISSYALALAALLEDVRE